MNKKKKDDAEVEWMGRVKSRGAEISAEPQRSLSVSVAENCSIATSVVAALLAFGYAVIRLHDWMITSLTYRVITSSHSSLNWRCGPQLFQQERCWQIFGR